MKIGIYANQLKDNDLSVTRGLSASLKAKGAEVLSNYDFKSDNYCMRCESADTMIENVDALVFIGGDGTLLTIAEKCAYAGIPILGINLGKLGFLTEAESFEIDSLCDALTKRKYKTEQRAMLEACFGKEKYLALNDAVVVRDNHHYSKVIELSAYAGEVLIDKYWCDGLIVATPTGSTAYSLSVGGAILSPFVNAFIISPISPHSLRTRPIVIEDSQIIKIKAEQGKESVKPMLIIDGKNIDCKTHCDEVIIKKSKYFLKFIKLNETSFFQRLHSKLNKWN
jgi:NAD+ kinase